jgi:hypothetical protein
MIAAQKVACTNQAAFVMSFVAKSGVASSASSGNFPIDQTRVIDLAGAGIAEGDVIAPEVHAVLGKTVTSADRFVYEKNGQTVTYRVSGTTFDYGVHAIGRSSGQRLPGFPAGIPLDRYDFLNWANDLQVPKVWTCAPRTPQEVADVCNWAAQRGFRVRPRGVMHNWSPLTVTQADDDEVLLVDLTKYLCELEMIPAAGGLPPRIRAGAGAVMIDLLTFLEAQPGGGGAADGYAFPHTPAPGNLTVGGVLAINAHGTAVPRPPADQMQSGYGSMSNRIVELTCVVTDPAGSPGTYVVRKFRRDEPDAKALTVALGRTLIVEAVLEVVPNYNLRCRSITNIEASTLFAKPTSSTPAPNSFAAFVEKTGRLEIIWFPFTENPWVHLWNVEPQKPAASREVTGPNNYPFADNLDPELQRILDGALASGRLGGLTPSFAQLMFKTTNLGFDGKNFFGVPTYPVSRDIWGASKNLLLYIQDSTLEVTANGYAVHMKRGDLQLAVSDFVTKYESLIAKYQARFQFPINSPVEIRVTGLDDPGDVAVAGAETPILSSTCLDDTAKTRGWDVALWLDVLTLPGTPHADELYEELETWLLQRFVGNVGRVMPEWSKGWGYGSSGAWTNSAFLKHVRKAYTDGRPAGADWNSALAVFCKYDAKKLFRNSFLDALLIPA